MPHKLQRKILHRNGNNLTINILILKGEEDMMKDNKKELIERTTQEFAKMNDDNKMFILGYMLGVQQERQRAAVEKRTA